MKNLKKVLFTALILTTIFGWTVEAQELETIDPPIIEETVSIHLSITTNDETLYDEDISISACNSDNSITTEIKITAYCAILQSGVESDWNWDWAPGAFLNSLGGVAGYTSKDKEDNDVYHFWSWYLNNAEAMDALNQYELQAGDSILIDFIDPIEEEPEVSTLIQENSSSGGSSKKNKKKEDGQVLGASTETTFDIKKAWDFLYSQQKENGSFGENIFNDWASIAIATDEGHKNETIKLIKYMQEIDISDASLTDFERHAMALMSLGLNPYNTNGVNYIKKIIDAFNGKQFGDPNEYNDDIFAMIVLQNTGYTILDIEIINTIKFILEKQKENGSWGESIDMTGASISALAQFQDREDIKNSLSKAKNFLKNNQEKDGGFENVSSTAWAIEGILALGEKPEDWEVKGVNPHDFLALNQDTDGGIKNENLNSKIWETAYVLKALSLKTWNQVMQKFEKKENEVAQIIENPIKKVPVIVKKATVKTPENKSPIQNLEEIAIQNTAEVINTIDENEQKKLGFFARVFKNIFRISN